MNKKIELIAAAILYFEDENKMIAAYDRIANMLNINVSEEEFLMATGLTVNRRLKEMVKIPYPLRYKIYDAEELTKYGLHHVISVINTEEIIAATKGLELAKSIVNLLHGDDWIELSLRKPPSLAKVAFWNKAGFWASGHYMGDENWYVSSENICEAEFLSSYTHWKYLKGPNE
jgi:hypothetical protein